MDEIVGGGEAVTFSRIAAVCKNMARGQFQLRLGALFLLIPALHAAALSVRPSSGSGARQVFTVTALGARGAAQRSVAMVINSTLGSGRSCYARYYPLVNTVYLQNDAGDGWASSGTPGTNAVLGNDQCSIDLKGSSVSGESDLNLSLAIIFQPHFAGPKTIWLEAQDDTNGSVGWQAAGTWSVQALVNLGAPAWTRIMTPATPAQYLKYSGKTKTEIDPRANKLTLPYHYYLPDVPGNDPSLASGVCTYPDAPPDAPPFWYDFAGNRLSGKPKDTIPSEYSVTPPYDGIGFGLRLRASFGGVLKGDGVIYETAYYHQQRCDAGGMEFGFYRNVIPAQTVFYFSNNSNCGVQPYGYCHISDSASSDLMNEDNHPGEALTSNNHGWIIDHINIGGAPATFRDLYYSVYILPDRSAPNGYRFQVEVFDPGTSTHVNCDAYDVKGNMIFANKPCGFPIRPGGWYRIDQLYSKPAVGYVTVGIQRKGGATVVTPVDFAVEEVSTGKR